MMRRWHRHHTATGERTEFVKPRAERLRRRVIGIVPEGRIPPERVGRRHRIPAPVTQAAERAQMAVCDPGWGEHLWQDISVELWVRPRAWDGAHIHEQIDRDLPKQTHEFDERAGRMAYREDFRHRSEL
jgi:hypothetical protein